MKNDAEDVPVKYVGERQVLTEAHESTVHPSIIRAVGAKALRGAAVVGVGGVLALGINNLYGAHSDIGPVHVSIHAKWGASVGLTSDIADLKLDRSSKIPVGVYADVEGSDGNITDPKTLVKEAGIAGDPAAIMAQLKSDYMSQAELAFGVGGATALGLYALREWAKRGEKRKNSISHIIYSSAVAATTLGIGATAGSLPTHTFNAVNWKQSVVAIGGNTYNIGYGGVGAKLAVDEINKNETYYNTIKDNLVTALAPVAAEDANLRPNQKKINVYSDWHCNYGMARNIAQIDKSLGINVTYNAGDNNLGGTSVEKICEEVLANNLKDTTNYFSDGNHDPDSLSQVLIDKGFKNVDGKSVNIYGADILGFNDPTLSPAFKSNFSLRDSREQSTLDNIKGETNDETEKLQNQYRDKVVNKYKDKVAEDTCDQQPDILINHEPQQTPDAARDCAILTINGHTHNLKKLQQTSPNHFSINDGSIGGAAPNTQSIGYPLGKEASSYIIYIGEDGKPAGVRYITIQPNKKVTVSDYQPLSTNLPITPIKN